MRNGDKGMKVLGLIVILMFVGSIFSGVVAATTYDPQAAVIYSDTWWNGRNPNYHDYSNEGGDCANFASQCLIAGGLDLSGHPGADSWGCIPSCTNLHDYLVNYLGTTYETRPKSQVEPIWFVPGDPAIFPTPKHAVFAVTGDATHYATCNAHSTDRNHKTIQWFFDNSNWNSCTYYHIPTDIPTPPAPPTLTSPGSSSGPGPTIDTLTPTLQWNSVSNSNADKYLYDRGIATGQSVGYYEPYQTQLDSELHNIKAPNQPPTAIIDSITPDPAEQGTDTVFFSGHGTDPDGTVEAYNWSSSIDGPLSTSAAFTKPASELSVGTHTFYFKVQDNDGAWSTEDTEDLTIYHGPELSYSPESHDFCDMREGETDNTTFEIWNSGTDTLTYSLSETCAWLEVHPTSGSSTGEHNTITVDMDTTGLFEGSHTGDITINLNDGSGTFTVMVNVVPCPCGNMSVNPTSWSPTANCSESDSQIVTVSASDGIVNGVTVSKVSGPTWLSVSPTDLGDIASGSSKTFTITASPPSEASGDYPYTITVSNTCGSPSSIDVSGTIHVDCPESSWRYKVCKWTYMVYLDGDNNLEGAGIDDFMEMSSVGSTSDVNIVVQFDRIPGYDTSYGDWKDCKRFHVTFGMTPTAANALINLGECNMGDPNTLRDFVEWTMTNFPADNYALILWNHGDGWKSINKWVPWADDIKDAKDAGLSRGICWDNTNKDYLSLQETEVALTGKYVQLLGYDACLMHMVEVVYQVMTNAGVSVGSEEVEPWDGWPYDTILTDLTVTPAMNEDALGTVIVDRYMVSYGYTGSKTQSAMDNSALPNLVAAVDTLAQALMTEINAGHVADVQQARNAAEEIYYNYYIDLYHFAEMVDIYVPGAAAQAQAVMNEVSGSMYEAHGTSVPNDHGLSIYFPEAEWAYLSSYENTKFAVDTHWDEFLKKYYAPTICGNMNVNPTSWRPTINCGESDNEIVTVSASDGIVNAVTVSKVSGPTWLSVSPTDLGDIASGSSKTFTMTAAPPSETSGDFGYTVRVSNTCGTPSTRDVSGTINVSCPCGNMGVNSTSWSTTLNCSKTDNEIVTVSATGGSVKGVTVGKISGPTWLSVSPTDLGDIASGSSKTFTMTAAPPSETSGDFGYTVRVSNTCGTPSTRDVSGTINVSCPCGNMGVNSTSRSTTLNCSETDNEIVTVSATGGTVKGVTVSKVSGPTWLSVSPTDLGDIASGSSKTFTMTAAPPSETSGDFTYTVRVSNTCGTPSTRDVSETINVSCPCGNMGVNSTSWSPTINCSESDNEIVTVSATGGTVKGVTVSKVSGPTWLSVSPTDLSDIASGSSKTFTMTTSPPSKTSGDFPYTVTVSNTCGSPSSIDVTGTIHVDCPESSWTYMVYLDGDNNLEDAGIDDFMEMSSVGSTSDVNIVVQFDRIPGYDSSYGDWTDCKRFHVTSGMTPTPANATEDLGECNMGDPNTLDAFVMWAMTEYPANNYALILWNHGSGWKKWKWNDPDPDIGRGVCWDDTSGGDYLTLRETEQALTGKYVDLLGYDACLMHMMAVVYQVMDNAGVSVGSEEYEPEDGWPYDTILTDLTVTPTMNEYTLGEVIVDRYMASYPTHNDLTQSAMDNSALPNLGTAVDNLAQALITEINAGHVADVQQARNAAEEIHYNYYIDLYHFAQKIQTYVPGAAAQAQTVMNEVSKMYEAHGTSVPNDHGLSIYFPRVEGDYLASYDNTAFASDTQWNEFLKKYYNPPTQGADIAVFSAPLWFVDKNGDHLADEVFGYGFAGATPLVGDFNQDGSDDIAVVYLPWWFVDTNGDHIADETFAYGFAGGTPLVGDFNQDGKDDIAVVSLPTWFVDTDRDQVADDVFGYGFAGATPLVGDFNQDGNDDIAVVNLPWWFVDTDRDQVADDVFGYGFAGATPIVGDIG